MHNGGILKVGGIILGVATTAFGGIAEIVGFTDLKLGSGWISIGGFAIFAIVMGWIILGQQKEIGVLKDSRPSVEWGFYPDLQHGVIISVQNNGAEAEFQAQIEVTGGTESSLPPDWRNYNGYWDNVLDNSVTIMRGLTKELKLADFMLTNNGLGYLRLFRNSGHGRESRDTGCYPVIGSGAVVPAVVLRITISSIPSAIVGPIVSVLSISANGNVTQGPYWPKPKLTWRQQLSFRKASSQT